MKKFYAENKFPTYVDEMVKIHFFSLQRATRNMFVKFNTIERSQIIKLSNEDKKFIRQEILSYELPNDYGIAGMYKIPWQLLSSQMRIVIYGAGDVGYCYARQLQTNKQITLVGIVDKRPEFLNNDTLTVSALETIGKWEYDIILIAIKSKVIADEIRRKLLNIGIADKKIVWDEH